MEGIALDVGARHRGVEEGEVEGGVVADENRAAAAAGAHRVADLAEDPLQRVALRDRRAQRVMRIDAGHRERLRVEARTRKGLHVKVMRRATAQGTAGV